MIDVVGVAAGREVHRDHGPVPSAEAMQRRREIVRFFQPGIHAVDEKYYFCVSSQHR